MLFEAIAAGCLGAALLWLILQPILAPFAAASPGFEPLDPEETPRGQALLALREIEFDRATGKLSEQDFEQLYHRYSARAAALLDQDSATDPVEVLIARHSAALGATGNGLHCPSHGPAVEPGAVFCISCGGVLQDDSAHCASCRTLLPDESRFCPGCGNPVAGGRDPLLA